LAYSSAVNSIQPVSYIMGELVDSSEMTRYTLQQYHDRAAQYLSALGSRVDIWEVGNEVNGNWTGNYTDVGAKIYDAWQQVHAAGKRSALTLWYDAGCDNGPSELDPIAFTNQYVPTDIRNGIDYVLVSYYEKKCNNTRPSAATLTTFLNELHALYPNAKLGFGEIGFPHPVTPSKFRGAVDDQLQLWPQHLNAWHIGGYSGGTVMKTCCRIPLNLCGRRSMLRLPPCRYPGSNDPNPGRNDHEKGQYQQISHFEALKFVKPFSAQAVIALRAKSPGCAPKAATCAPAPNGHRPARGRARTLALRDAYL
jgi:hypothetical protein